MKFGFVRTKGEDHIGYELEELEIHNEPIHHEIVKCEACSSETHKDGQ